MLIWLMTLLSCDWLAYRPTAPPAPPPAPAGPLIVTAVDGSAQSLPDPERIVIVEAIRSLDWCVYCVAQMRAWQEAMPQVHAMGARLVVLSPDEPELLKRMVAKRGLSDVMVVPATPELFERLDIPMDRNRPELPQPTTLVLDPAAGERVRISDANFRTRADPTATLETLTQGRASKTTPSPDWDGAATLALVRDGDVLALEAVLSDGFHLYGANETTSIPVALRLDDGTEAEVPPGTRTERGGLVSWLLEGAIRITVPAPREEEVSGRVSWQLCNDQSCSAPRDEAFVLAPEAGRIIRPAD
ncbi:MAG: redoxin domain-containing protein [Myxococcota bacterium]